MDWFLITDVWTEKIGKYAGYRVRLEKLDLSTKGWWTEQGSDEPHHSNQSPPNQKCGDCGKSSLQIYVRPGWMCLENSCSKFWKFRDAEPKDFEYHPDFLNYRHPRGPDIPNPGPLAEIVDRIIEPSEGITDREEWRGIVCPECRKCIQRVTWDAWDCANDPSRGPQETCCYKVVRKMREISLESVLDVVKPYTSKKIEGELEPVVDTDSLKPFEVRTYQLPGVGSITHFVSNASINGRMDGPDDMFSQLQRLDLGLKRYPLGSTQGEGVKSEKARATPAKSKPAKAKPVKAKPALGNLCQSHLMADLALVVVLIFFLSSDDSQNHTNNVYSQGDSHLSLCGELCKSRTIKPRDRLLT
jgi:hypothetical protein